MDSNPYWSLQGYAINTPDHNGCMGLLDRISFSMIMPLVHKSTPTKQLWDKLELQLHLSSINFSANFTCQEVGYIMQQVRSHFSKLMSLKLEKWASVKIWDRFFWLRRLDQTTFLCFSLISDFVKVLALKGLAYKVASLRFKGQTLIEKKKKKKNVHLNINI